MDKPVYLDWNAGAPLLATARDAMAQAFAVAGNPSSVHGAGRAARRIVEDARAEIARIVGTKAERVVFAGSGTEANALALNGAEPARCLVSAVEHDCVHGALRGAAEIPVTADGVVDLEAFSRQLAETRPVLVAVMLANNETGVLQPVAEIARLARATGTRVHCDAVQAFGRIDVDFAALGVDTLAVSAHKLGGPQGVGALIARSDAALVRLHAGGGQERGLRPGTHNVAGIAGFAAAARQGARMDSRSRDRLETTLRAAVPGLEIYGAATPRLPNTSCLRLAGVPAQTQVMAMDIDGFAVSAGAACSSGKVKESRVLAAMGAGSGAGEAIRVSFGPTTTETELDAFAASWIAMASRLSPSGARHAA